MSVCSVDATAYCKLMLHAARVLGREAAGFLLGKGSVDGKQGRLDVTDAVPCCHLAMMGPMLERAAAMAEEYAKARGEGMEVVGWYYSSESTLASSSSGSAAAKIAAKLDAEHPGSVLLQLSISRLSNAADHALLAFGRDATRNFMKSVAIELADASIESFNQALRDGREMEVVDVDEHMDDVSKDWRNPGIKF